MENASKESSINGLDADASETWIYPTNYPVRDYQYAIVENALYQNTLVSLPTGLGKTFIAAVVMYNFYRWYPTSKIIFMAPTRPLVKQQIEACYDVMAIPKIVTAELTGNNLQASRGNIWNEKRLFFITPQILQNDLDLFSSLALQIKCLVIDEAHRAKGNHAYCEVIKKLYAINKDFRVLALSATPGKDDHELGDIIKNLLISRLEFRSDESPDVVPYLFTRNIVPIIVDLDDKLKSVKDEFIQILDIYTRPLLKHNVIHGNCGNLSKGRIFMLLKEYQEKTKTFKSKFYPEILRHFNICLTLYHGYDLLLRNGLRSFLLYFKEHISNPLLQNNEKLEVILRDVEKYLGPEINITHLPNGTIASIPKIDIYGHPKFIRMRDILVEHFTSNGSNSRAMVFCEYCEVVRETYAILIQFSPLIKPKYLMGQHTVKQKQQISTVKAFKNGECNCLISTSIGEEGLDIGEIDLIICFDICSKSPTRMIQRIGRTGRKKNGKVFILTTRGREEQVLNDCLIKKKTLTKRISNSFRSLPFFEGNSRMIPDGVIPKCEKRHINSNKTAKESSTLKALFNNISAKSSVTLTEKLNALDLIESQNNLPAPLFLSLSENPIVVDNNEIFLKSINLSKRSNYHKSLRSTMKYCSVNGQILDSLYQHIDWKRYNLPMAELNRIQIDQLKPINKGGNSNVDGLKQCDIRNIFTKSKELPSSIEELCVKNTANVFEKPECIELNEEIANYLSINTYKDRACDICCSTFRCSDWLIKRKKLNNAVWTDINESLIDKIDINILKDYISNYASVKECNEDDDVILIKDDDDGTMENLNTKYIDVVDVKEEYDDIKVKDVCDDDNKIEDFDGDIKMVDDCFEMSPIQCEYSYCDKILSFFKLNSLEDIFVPLEQCDHISKLLMESADERTKLNNESLKFVEDCDNENSDISFVENSYLLNESKVIIQEARLQSYFEQPLLMASPSPKRTLLNHFTSSKQEYPESTKTESSHKINEENVSSNLDANSAKERNDRFSTSNKCPNISPLENKKTVFLSLKKINENIERSSASTTVKRASDISIEDLNSFCDMSIFGLNDAFVQDKKVTSTKKAIDIADICDLSIFALDTYKNDTNDKEPNANINNDKNNIKKNSSNSDNDFDCTQSLLLFNTEKNNTSKGVKLKTTSFKTNSQDSSFLLKRHRRKTLFKLKSPSTNLEKSVSDLNITTVENNVLVDNDKLKDDKIIDLSLDDDDLRCSSPANFSKSDSESPVKKAIPKRTKKPKKNCSFIDYEAEVSILISSSDEDITDDNKLEKSFVNDSILTDANTTNMQKIYVQTTKSPIKNYGNFKIPELKPIHKNTNIFSQEVSVLNDTYNYDSFCVNDDTFTEDEELSELEQLENVLESKKRKKHHVKKKRKRIIIQISDDSD